MQVQQSWICSFESGMLSLTCVLRVRMAPEPQSQKAHVEFDLRFAVEIDGLQRIGSQGIRSSQIEK